MARLCPGRYRKFPPPAELPLLLGSTIAARTEPKLSGNGKLNATVAGRTMVRSHFSNDLQSSVKTRFSNSMSSSLTGNSSSRDFGGLIGPDRARRYAGTVEVIEDPRFFAHALAFSRL